jgi:hypothetical protein
MCPYKAIVESGGVVPASAMQGAAAGGGGGGGGGGGEGGIESEGGSGMQRGPGGGLGALAAGARPGGAYVPPSMRAGATPGAVRPPSLDDLVQLRVSNLSPETTEDDLRALFQPFGRLDQRIHIARQKETGESRGFAFLKYAWHKEAADAKTHLNGYRLKHMIIRVEFAENRDGGAGRNSLSGSGIGRHLSGYGGKLADTTGAYVL